MRTETTTLPRMLLVHAGLYLVGALLLLGIAMPVEWDTPANLGSSRGWGFILVVVAVVALVLGALEGGPLRVGPQGLGWLVAVLAMGIGVAGGSFFIDTFESAEEASASGRADVVMSQLVWSIYWLTHTLVVGVVLGVARHRRSDERSADTTTRVS